MPAFGALVDDLTGDGSGVECGESDLPVALQFTGSTLGSPICLAHRLLRQHGLVQRVVNGKVVRHVGTDLESDVDEVAVGYGQIGLAGPMQALSLPHGESGSNVLRHPV